MTVFDTNRLSTMIHIVIGYGLPLLIVLLTVVISETNSGDFYLRTDERGVANACWLSVRAMPAIVVPAGNLKVVLSPL